MIEELRTLAESLAELQARQQRAMELAGPAAGTDESGTVEVTWYGDTSRVDVSVRPGWRAKLGRSGLSTAVREALTAASYQSIAELGRALGEMPEEEAVGTGPAPSEESVADPHEHGWLDPERPMESLAAVFDAMEAQATAFEESLRIHTERRYVGSGASGAIRAEVTAPAQLAALEIDERWVGFVDEGTLSAGLTEAINQALASASEAAPVVPDFSNALAGGVR